MAPLILAAAACAVVTASQGRALEMSPRANFTLSRTSATIGDTLTYSVRVRVPAGWKVAFPPRKPALGDFQVLGGQRLPEDDAGGGWIVSGEDLTLAAYETGSLAVPPTPIRAVSASGDSIVLSGDTLFVDVNGVLGEGDGELRDIKGLATVPEGSNWRVIGLAGLAAVALLIAVYLMRRRSAMKALAPGTPPVAPHIAAMRRLEALLASRLIETGRFKEFYTELSDLLRVYLSRRFLIPAPEMTTRELEVRLEYLGLPNSFRRRTCRVLSESDMVKFAKFKPGMESAIEAAKLTEGIVRERMEALASAEPRAEEEGDAEGGSSL